MAKLVAAKAWCNNQVAYLAWRSDGVINDCLGFSITRIHDDGMRRVLPTWVAFTGQSNPDWREQDTNVWPVQKYMWRDLTLRRSRDSLKIRDAGFTVQYEITPVGRHSPDLPLAPLAPHPNAYVGSPIPLAFIGPSILTNKIEVGLERGQISVAFNNGILSTQNLRKQLDTPKGTAPSASELRRRIETIDDPTRNYLAGDVLPLLKRLFERAVAEGGVIHAALYELDDPELLALLLANHERLYLILSTSGKKESKNQPTVWDTTNTDSRAALREKLGDRLQDRMFNNSAHIGHNKFAILSVDGTNEAVWTGSTNWTPTGLCGQTNNAIVVEDETFAGHYRDYWDRLHADILPIPSPISAPNNTDQGKALRAANALPRVLTLDHGKSKVALWCSPNTPKTGSPKTRTVPPDLEVVFQHMKAAKQAIFFLVFNPGRTPDDTGDDINTVVSATLDFVRHQPNLLVKGAISDPTAIPGYVQPPKGVEKPKKEDRIPNRAIYAPEGAPNVLMVRATAITDLAGDFEKELLTVGTAIIHDKIVVIDPLDEKDCVVITGSHNLGFKASYANDENLVIIKGNAKLAQSYAVHVLDVFEHFRFRSVLEEKKRQAILDRLEAEAKAERDGTPAAVPEQKPFDGGGYLSLDETWQKSYFSGPKVKELDYFLGK